VLDRIREKFNFSKKHRLYKKKAIDLLFRKGRYHSCGFLKFRYLPSENGYTKVVISISKKVGNAPKRNRMKRLIREALRLSGFLQSTSIHCAIYVTKPLQKRPDLTKTQELIGQFFSKLPDEIKYHPQQNTE